MFALLEDMIVVFVRYDLFQFVIVSLYLSAPALYLMCSRHRCVT